MAARPTPVLYVLAILSILLIACSALGAQKTVLYEHFTASW
jgi:hypothetical protein